MYKMWINNDKIGKQAAFALFIRETTPQYGHPCPIPHPNHIKSLDYFALLLCLI